MTATSKEVKSQYEGMVVLNLQGEEGLDALVSAVSKEMEAEGASISKVDKMGKREFAYNARKQATGFYVNFHLTVEPEAVAKIRERLTLNTDVYLQYYQKAS
ncbi:MAG: 30S ribosomal protein S6 [Verrucomicrobiota bacterium]